MDSMLPSTRGADNIPQQHATPCDLPGTDSCLILQLIDQHSQCPIPWFEFPGTLSNAIQIRVGQAVTCPGEVVKLRRNLMCLGKLFFTRFNRHGCQQTTGAVNNLNRLVRLIE